MSGGVPGSRSPSVSNLEANPLKVSIALGQGKQPAIIQKGPFYLMKPDPIVVSEVTGATNLMQSKNLEHSYTKLASKKMKDNLSSFLPGLPGVIDTPGTQDNSSLRGLIEKPPVCGKELLLLNQLQLAGFRLHPGPLPEQYRTLLNQPSRWVPLKRRRQRTRRTRNIGAVEVKLRPMRRAGGQMMTERSAEKRNTRSTIERARRGRRRRRTRRRRRARRHDRESEERKKKKKD